MKVKVGDYVIFVTTNKPQLGVISSIDPLRVQLEPDEKLKRPIVDIQADNIQAVLGAKTISGTAFGIDVANRYVDLVENGNFGDLALYGYGIKQYVKVLKSAFSIVYKGLNKKGVPTDGLQEILFKAAPLKGAMAGLCKSKKDQCTITIDPNKCTVEDLPLVIAHELGHYFWLSLESNVRQAWLRAYLRYVKPRSFSKEQLAELKDALSDMNPRDLMRDLDDDDAKFVLRHCVRYLCQSFKVSQSELNAAWENEKETFLSMFPVSIKINEFEPVISSYACKNYKETFAEAFAFFVTGKKLPSIFNKLVAKTIAVL